MALKEDVPGSLCIHFLFLSLPIPAYLRRSVVVRNVALSTRPAKLEEFFSTAGEVLFVDVLTRYSGASKGTEIAVNRRFLTC